jgi:hypothetical protein
VKPEWIKKACVQCKHGLVQLAPNGDVRSAGCGHARDTAPASARKSMRYEDTKRLGACPLEEAKAA